MNRRLIAFALLLFVCSIARAEDPPQFEFSHVDGQAQPLVIERADDAPTIDLATTDLTDDVITIQEATNTITLDPGYQLVNDGTGWYTLQRSSWATTTMIIPNASSATAYTIIDALRRDEGFIVPLVAAARKDPPADMETCLVMVTYATGAWCLGIDGMSLRNDEPRE